MRVGRGPMVLANPCRITGYVRPPMAKAVPDHWHTAGARTSAPSGFKSSRNAATPVPCASELLRTRFSRPRRPSRLQAHGFDPGMGILHTDKRYRSSLAHDLMEPLRPDGRRLGDLTSRKHPLALAWRRLRDARRRVPARTSDGSAGSAGWAPAFRPALADSARGACSSRCTTAAARGPRGVATRRLRAREASGDRRAGRETLSYVLVASTTQGTCAPLPASRLGFDPSMALLETLTLGIGASIVRALFKILGRRFETSSWRRSTMLRGRY